MIRFILTSFLLVFSATSFSITPEELTGEFKESWEKAKYLNSFDGKNLSEEILWKQFVEKNGLNKKKAATPAGEVSIDGAAGPLDTAAGPPDIGGGQGPLADKNMQKILNSIPADKRKRLEQAILSGNKEAVREEMKKLASLDTLKAMSSKESTNSLIAMLQDNWRDKSILDTTRDLKKTLADSFLRPVFDFIPKSYLFMATMIKDSKALPTAFGALADRKRLLYFLGANLLVFFIGKFIKRNYNKGNHNSGGVSQSTLLSQLLMRLMMTLAMRVGLVIYFFGKELTPMWDVFKQVYF